MYRLLFLTALVWASATQAAQSVDPSVLKALNTAQAAQQQGNYSAARRALDGAKAAPDTLEQALLWRSRGYLAWAEGNNAQAIELLDKALKSKHLDAEQSATETINLARLNLVEKRYKQVISLLAPLQAKANEEQLQMLVQAYQGAGQPAKALPLAERYVKANPKAADSWLQFLVSMNAQLKRYPAAENWQRQLLKRHVNDVQQWRQLAAIEQISGKPERALATLRAAYRKGLRFKASELDNLVLMASAADQPWQGATLLQGMLEQGYLQRSSTREERLGNLWWQARDRQKAVQVFQQLAKNSGSGQHWLKVAQLQMEQAHWKAGLAALKKAEAGGANRKTVNDWRRWAESELSFAEDSNLLSNR